jgi:hypothetical protein
LLRKALWWAGWWGSRQQSACARPIWSSGTIPYYPFWSLVIITLDIFVIWAVAAHGGDLREPV